MPTPTPTPDNINRSEIARATGTDLAHVSRIFSGQRKPSFMLACKIAQHLGITLDALEKLIQK